MEAEHTYTLPFDDTVTVESPTFGMENLDCVENDNYGVPNDCEEEVVLDSDDDTDVTKWISSDDIQRLDKWKLSPASKPTYVGCLRRSKNLFQHRDSVRSTTNFENTSQQKPFSEVNGRISSQVNKIVATKSRVEEDHYWCQAAEVIKDEFFEGNVVTETLTGYALDEKRASSSNHEVHMDEDKDFPIHSCNIEPPELSNTESQVPEELSEANALDFVDHYLSGNNQDALNEVKAGGVNKIISPPIFSRVGPQRLASRMNIQNSVKNLGVFDWPERQSEDAKSSFSRTRKMMTIDRKNYGLKNQKVASVQSSKEPIGGMRDSEEERKFLVEGHLNVEANFLRKSDEQLDVGVIEQQFEKSDGNQSDVLETYDVGFDTQLAAEAIESLLYAPPLKCDAVCAPQIPETNLLKKEEYTERVLSKEFKIDGSSSKPTQCSSAEINLLRGKHRGFSSIVHRTRHQVSLNLRGLENLTTNSITEPDFPNKRRKQHDLVESNDNLLKVAAVRGKVSKSGTDMSRKARKLSMNKRGELLKSVAATLSQEKLENWASKGKRTPKGARLLSNRSSNLYPALCTDDGHDFKYPTLNHKTERRPQPLEFDRLSRFSSEQNHSGLLAAQCINEPCSLICKYPVTSQKMMPIDFKRVESTESAKLNEATSIATNLLRKDMKCDMMSTGNSDPSYSLNGHKKARKCMGSLSKSSLTQELIKLGYAEQLPDFLPRGSRRRKGAGDIRVLFSQSLDIKLIKHQKKIVARLGFISTSNCCDATHFVTDSFVRTRNMLEAIACGKPIVTHLWLESCGIASCFVDEKKYILRDAKKEKVIGFNMPASLELARKHPLLKGRRVIITPSVKPNRDTLISLAKAVHGEVVDESNNKTTCDELLIISCEEDYKVCIPYLEKGTFVYSSELLLNGIVIQKLEYNRTMYGRMPRWLISITVVSSIGISFSQSRMTKTAKGQRQSYVEKDEVFMKKAWRPTDSRSLI